MLTFTEVIKKKTDSKQLTMNHIIPANILGRELYPCCNKTQTISEFTTTFDKPLDLDKPLQRGAFLLLLFDVDSQQ